MKQYTKKKLYEFHQLFYQFLIDEAKKLNEEDTDYYYEMNYYWTNEFKILNFYKFIDLNKISYERLPEFCLNTCCFCCKNIGISNNDKCKCLLKFPGSCYGDISRCLGGLYLKFINNRDKNDVIKILRKIKNLPIRDENE